MARMVNERDLDEMDGDAIYRISDLITLLEKASRKYGRLAEVRFDGGYNNVSVRVRPTKNSRKKYA